MGRPKLLLDWRGRPLVHHATEIAVESGASPVIVVTGPRDAEMRAILADLPVTVAHNPDYAEGMSTSLRTGIQHLPTDVEGTLIMLGDQPLLTPAILGALMLALAEPGRLIVQPRYAGVPGNPVGFARTLFADLCIQRGDQGARDLIRTRRTDVYYVDFESAQPQLDVDTPEDYAAIVASEGQAQ